MTTGDVRTAMDKAATKGLAPGRSSGVVKIYNAKRNPFGGYIVDDRTSHDVFVHKSAVEPLGIGALAPGQRVEFDIVEDGFGGFKAANLRILAGSAGG